MTSFHGQWRMSIDLIRLSSCYAATCQYIVTARAILIQAGMRCDRSSHQLTWHADIQQWAFQCTEAPGHAGQHAFAADALRLRKGLATTSRHVSQWDDMREASSLLVTVTEVAAAYRTQTTWGRAAIHELEHQPFNRCSALCLPFDSNG